MLVGRFMLPLFSEQLEVGGGLQAGYFSKYVDEVSLRLIAHTLGYGLDGVVAVMLLIVHSCHGLAYSEFVEKRSEVFTIFVVDDLRHIA